MKKLMHFKTFLFACFVIGATVFISSCGDDEPDTPAVLDREAFVGSYLGAFNCPGLLGFANSDSLVFSIDPAIEVTDLSGIILNLTIDGNALALSGSVSGDTLIVMDQLNGVPVEFMGLNITGDIAGDGSATITNNNLEGSIALELSAAVLGPISPITDNCAITGVKQ